MQMSSVTPFQFEAKSIRVVTDESGEPLFVAKDICEALGYKDPTTAVRNHCKGVQKLRPLPLGLGGCQKFVEFIAKSLNVTRCDIYI